MGRYTQEFKSESIALAIKSHRSHQEIALDLGINPSTFRNWMSEAMMTDSSKNNKVTKKSQIDLEKATNGNQWGRQPMGSNQWQPMGSVSIEN